MKVTVMKPVEIEVVTVCIVIPVRDEVDGMAKDFPLRKGDVWSAAIDVDSGRISGWRVPGEFHLFEKVVDAGVYTLLDAAGREVGKIDQNYVPNSLIPGEYGDYIDLKIRDGVVTNWPKQLDRDSLAEFFE